MSWSYSGDPQSSPLDLARFLCGDTDSADPLVTNEEITYYLSTGLTPQRVALKLGNAILIKLAREVNYKIGPESVDASDRYKHYKDWWTTAKQELIGESGAPSWQEPSGANSKSIFDIGMNDNRRC